MARSSKSEPLSNVHPRPELPNLVSRMSDTKRTSSPARALPTCGFSDTVDEQEGHFFRSRPDLDPCHFSWVLRRRRRGSPFIPAMTLSFALCQEFALRTPDLGFARKRSENKRPHHTVGIRLPGRLVSPTQKLLARSRCTCEDLSPTNHRDTESARLCSDMIQRSEPRDRQRGWETTLTRPLPSPYNKRWW